MNLSELLADAVATAFFVSLLWWFARRSSVRLRPPPAPGEPKKKAPWRKEYIYDDGW